LTGTASQFGQLFFIDCDDAGYIYSADWGTNGLRRTSIATGETKTIAHGGSAPYKDGPGSAAFFNNLFGVTVTNAGDVYVGSVGGVFRVSRIIDDAAR
jgi:hypothetical protein